MGDAAVFSRSLMKEGYDDGQYVTENGETGKKILSVSAVG
jgi:hypothetical protein